MIVLSDYRLEEKAFFFEVKTNETHRCPICGEPLAVIGTRSRVLYNGDDDKKVLIIRRLRCTNEDKCGHIHHELPGCVVPYKRYSADVIEKIKDKQPIKDAPCPDGLIRRIRGWWNAILPYLLSVLESLTESLGMRFGEPPAFREMIRAAANSHRWSFALKVSTRSVSRPG